MGPMPEGKAAEAWNRPLIST